MDMAAAPFDTLKMAQKLEAAGFTPAQAATTTEAVAEAMAVADLATKADVEKLGEDLRGEIEQLGKDLRGEIVQLRKDMHGENLIFSTASEQRDKDIRAEMKAEFAAVRHEIDLLRRDMNTLGRDLTIRLGGMMIAGFGLLFGAMRYMLMHP